MRWTDWPFETPRPKQRRVKRFLAGAQLRERTLRRLWAVWRIYDQYQRAGLTPPSIREVAAELFMPQSWSSIAFYVEVLEHWGVLSNIPGRSRARRLLKPYNEWMGE